jgi:hypothetical protein
VILWDLILDFLLLFLFSFFSFLFLFLFLLVFPFFHLTPVLMGVCWNEFYGSGLSSRDFVDYHHVISSATLYSFAYLFLLLSCHFFIDAEV